MIVLAFNRVLSAEGCSRVQHQFEEAKRANRVIVVDGCTVLSDDHPAEQAIIKLSDGSVVFVPDGLTTQELLDAIRHLIETDEAQRTT